MLGIREPALYGDKTYKSLVKKIRSDCAALGVKVKCVQSNYEGKIVDYIQNLDCQNKELLLEGKRKLTELSEMIARGIGMDEAGDRQGRL